MKLYHGDCLEIMKDIPEESIDLIITSPPYDNLRTYNDTLDWNFDIFKSIANNIFRVLKNGGVIVWVVSDETVNGSETGTSFKQALYFKEIGLNIHDTMIWVKPAATDTGSQHVRYGNVFEYMFILSKGKPKIFNPLKDRINKHAGKFNKCASLREKNGVVRKTNDKGHITDLYGQRYNVWEMPPVVSNKERTGHPAQFPERLAKDHILTWSNKGDLVLDPFMGCGTTGVACYNTGRDFIGIEKDDNYFKIAEERINNAMAQLRLL